MPVVSRRMEMMEKERENQKKNLGIGYKLYP
jgi:hypothetical protein